MSKKTFIFQYFILISIAAMGFGCAKRSGGSLTSASGKCGMSASAFDTNGSLFVGLSMNVPSSLGDEAESMVIGTSVGAFTPTAISLGLARVGSPSGTLTVTIEGDSAGAPNGTSVASGTLTFSSISTNPNYITTTPEFYTINLSTQPILTTGKTYWIHLSSSAPPSATDYIIWAGASTVSVFAGTAQKNYNTQTWSSTSTLAGDLMTKFTCAATK